jgi:hypothetical protein
LLAALVFQGNILAAAQAKWVAEALRLIQVQAARGVGAMAAAGPGQPIRTGHLRTTLPRRDNDTLAARENWLGT